MKLVLLVGLKMTKLWAVHDYDDIFGICGG